MNFPDDSVFAKYFEVADWFINSNFIGQECTVVYPPIKVACTNPQHEVVGLGNIGIAAFGGPTTYSCEYCSNTLTIEQESTATIRLRLYWERKNWIKIGTVGFPDADCMVIGFMSDLAKFNNAKEIVFSKNEIEWRMTSACKPFPHGFGKNRYFVGYLKGQ